MFKRKTLNNDLAALDGRKFSLDKIMIIASFIILAIIAIVPVASIIVNALFVDGKLALDSFFKVLLNKENIGAMWNTITIAFWVTIFGTIMGLFYAWLLGRSDLPMKVHCLVFHTCSLHSLEPWLGTYCYRVEVDI